MKRVKKPRNKPISIAARKSKGRNLQKWTCQKISELFDEPWGYEDECLIQPRIMGQKGVDVILRGKMEKLFPFAIECKAIETINWKKMVRQAKKNTPKGKNWMCVLKTTAFHDKIIVMNADKFFEIYKEGIKNK